MALYVSVLFFCGKVGKTSKKINSAVVIVFALCIRIKPEKITEPFIKSAFDRATRFSLGQRFAFAVTDIVRGHCMTGLLRTFGECISA